MAKFQVSVVQHREFSVAVEALSERAAMAIAEGRVRDQVDSYVEGRLFRLEALEAALGKHMPEETTWTKPEGGMSIWVTLPPGFDAGELLIHVRERGVLFVPGRYFYQQSPQMNTLRLGFAGLDEKKIFRGVQTLSELLKIELRKRQRGARSESISRVALV